MDLRSKLSGKTGLKPDKMPGFQIIGNIAMLKFPWKSRVPLKQKSAVARAVMKEMPGIKTVCEISGVSGEMRKPKIRLLAGARRFETIHKESGISYLIDVSKIMFSKGNLFERQRVISQIKTGETVVDMFAGIGYFSLGIAKFSKASKIISIEKNRVSFGFLERNIILNRISNTVPIRGDCREVSKKAEMRGIADRIMMGYLPRTHAFLPHAFRFAKNVCIIHYHDTFTDSELWKKPHRIVNYYTKKAGFKAKILSEKKVKSFAPKVWHVVIDFEIRK